MDNIIKIEHLKKYFKDVKAVDDISFAVEKGQLFAFLGLNGAGKSTTINILCGMLQKDSGSILIDGLSIDNELDKIKPKLGVVFQNSVLDAKLSVYDNLASRAMLYGLSKTQFQERLNFYAEKLEFKNLLKRPLDKLSGGQKRRVDIARALLHNPDILILDEPTTGLDPVTRILVWQLMDYLRQENNLTIILTTHYMEEASEADYIVIIDSGKIVASDTPNNLKNKYANDFIRLYQYDEKIIKIIEKQKLPYKKLKNTLEITVKDLTTAKNFISENKDLFTDFEVIKGKMDNVFLNITGKNLGEI